MKPLLLSILLMLVIEHPTVQMGIQSHLKSRVSQKTKIKEKMRTKSRSRNRSRLKNAILDQKIMSLKEAKGDLEGVIDDIVKHQDD